MVSIIIPTYNHALYLADSIASATAQTHENVEVVVVDDGSTDDTNETVSALSGERVRYIRQPNLGLPAARNTGLRHSRGDYIVFLDADDRLRPNHVSLGLRAFEALRGFGFVCGDTKPFGVLGGFHHVHRCAPRPDHYASLLRSCFIVNVGACLFPREVLTKVGGFDEGLQSSEDWDLFLKIARQYPIHCHHQPVLEYRRYPGQMSEDLERMIRGSAQALRAQWPYAKARREYRLAYYDGLNDIARYYGVPAIDLVMRRFSVGNWLSALRLARRILADSPRAFMWRIGLSRSAQSRIPRE